MEMMARCMLVYQMLMEFTHGDLRNKKKLKYKRMFFIK